MEITCKSCSASLRIPDDKFPKGVPVVNAACPQCQKPIEIHIPQPGAAPAPALAPVAAAPAPAPVPRVKPATPRAPEEQPAPPPATEDFSEDRKIAMLCFAAPDLLALAKEGLEAAGYTVHLPVKAIDALHWPRRGKYELVLIHEDFEAAFLKTLQPMAMSMRRHLCIGLVGKAVKTMDNMAAFAQSVNPRRRRARARQAQGDQPAGRHRQRALLPIFREALHDAGKA